MGLLTPPKKMGLLRRIGKSIANRFSVEPSPYSEEHLRYQRFVEADYWHHAGMMQALYGDYEGAIRFLKKSIDTKPETLYLWAALGMVYKRMGDSLITKNHVEARAAYLKAAENLLCALEMDYTVANHYKELAQVVKLIDREDIAADSLRQALTILNKALAADKTDCKSYLERSEVFELMGEYTSAISDVETALPLLKMLEKPLYVKNAERQISNLRERIAKEAKTKQRRKRLPSQRVPKRNLS